MAKRTRRSYDAEFKWSAVHLSQEPPVSQMLSAHLNML